MQMNKKLLIIAERNTGKTTYLYKKILKLYKEGKNIIVLDSATEHEEKSLLRKICNVCNDTVVINMCDYKNVIIDEIDIQSFKNNYVNYFPYSEIIYNKNKIICFDLSYFLEKGHDEYEKNNSIKSYNYYRKLYNCLSQQIIVMLILMDYNDNIENTVVVMDEIELPTVSYSISLSQKNLSFIAAVHPENAFGTFYSCFKKMNFIPFKGKDV